MKGESNIMRNDASKTRRGRLHDQSGAAWLFVALVAAVLFPVVTWGQQVRSVSPAERRFGMHRPAVNVDDLKLIRDVVIGPDEAGMRDVLDSMYQGYVLAWRDAARSARMDIKYIREEAIGGDDAAREAMQQKVRAREAEWTELSRSLEDRFFSDLKEILSEEQRARWSTFERDRRRQLSLRARSRLAGEGIDVILLVKSLDMPAEILGTIEALLDEYANELDAGLTTREDTADEVDRQMTSGNPNIDFASLHDMLLPHRERLRDVNVAFANRLADALPSPWGRELRDAFNRQRFPRIYAETLAHEYLDEAHELADITENQTSALDEIESQFEQALEALNQELMAFELERERKLPFRFRRMLEQRRRVDAGSNDASEGTLLAQTADRGVTADENAELQAEREAWQRRRALVEKTIDQAFNVLTPTQQEELPKDDVLPTTGSTLRGPLESGGNS